ncbi:MAG TPA: hypothetical protein VEP67_03415 [Thiobacillaceae bacterium]|nr:hypothetical protein [Thiobacillaceae bacterium]
MSHSLGQWLNQSLAFVLLAGAASLTQAHEAAVQPGRPWGLNDVSILYPLPESRSDLGDLIPPQEHGLKGAWFPYDVYRRLPAIDHAKPADQTYQVLRVVGIRLDPCFKSDGNCLQQVRLVWQPVAPASYGSSAEYGVLEAKDAAIHTLYTLTPTMFEALLTDYAALVKATGLDLRDEPLQIHPVLLKQGLDGKFATRLRSLLSKYVGPATLWRATAMQGLPGDDEWSFTGFNVRDGVLHDLLIPRLGTRSQRLQVAQLDHSSFANGLVHPLPDEAEDNYLPDILRERSANRVPKSAKALAIAIADIENPARNTPETVDCVSCHAAQPAGSLLSRTLSALHNQPEVKAHVFQSRLPLRNSGLHLADTHVLRAFGYIDRDPAISRRVTNESADVVRQLNGDPLEIQTAGD